jgi:hypothetical protein
VEAELARLRHANGRLAVTSERILELAKKAEFLPHRTGERNWKLAERVGFELLGVLILKNLACFAYARTARSGQKPGSRNEIGTVNGVDIVQGP